MITSPAFSGKRYAVLGLARSGMAAAEALLASGAQVTAWDRQEEPRAALEGRAEIADPLSIDLTGYDGVVVSPGVPLNTHPIADRASRFGVPVIGDIELFAQARADLPPHRVIGITGTNGKSTTTALATPSSETSGRAVPDGRQYRPAHTGRGSAAAERERDRCLRARTVQLPDRPDPLARLRGRGPAERYAGPSRPV